MVSIQNVLLVHCMCLFVYSLTIYAFVASLYGSTTMALVSVGFQSGLWFASSLANFGLTLYLDYGGAKVIPQRRLLSWHGFLVVFIIVWSIVCATVGFGLVALLLASPFAALCFGFSIWAGRRAPALLFKAWTILSIFSNFLFGILTVSIIGFSVLSNATWAKPWIWVLVCEALALIALQVLIILEFDRWRKDRGEYILSRQRLDSQGSAQLGAELDWQPADGHIDRDSSIESEGQTRTTQTSFEFPVVRSEPEARSVRCIGINKQYCVWTSCTLIAFVLSCFYFVHHLLIPHTRHDHDLPDCISCHCNDKDGDIQIIDDVLFKTTSDGQKLYLSIYNSTWQTSTKLPAVLLIHGGGFKYGDRNGTGDSEEAGLLDYSLIREEAMHFARHGFIAISIDYRLCRTCFALPPAFVVQDAIQDAKSAVRFIVKNADTWGVDKHRIVGFGDSAGAIILTTMNYVLDPGSTEQGVDPNAEYPSNISAVAGIASAFWPMVPHVFLQNHKRIPLTPWYALVIDSDYAVPVILSAFTYSFFLIEGIEEQGKWAMQFVTDGFFNKHVKWDARTRTRYRPSIMRFYLKALDLDGDKCQSEALLSSTPNISDKTGENVDDANAKYV